MRERAKARERFLIDQRLDRAEAREEGLAEGVVRGKIETARNMKRKGYAVADIADMTGLPVSEVERLG
jgi:predicted transposase/invertase (TIGR01784 family)